MAYLGVGWDVGGWCGSKQAVAVVSWQEGESELSWLGLSVPFSLSRRVPLSLSGLLAPALGHSFGLPRAERVSLAIDAPLAFPRAFHALLQGTLATEQVPEDEMANPYAYRDCDRWLHEQYGKKPLSASFDKLGNNATLAITLTALLQQQGFTLLPQQQETAELAMLEAYPAMMKQQFRSTAPATAAFSPLLPAELQPGNDSYDAALCALMALAHASEGRCPLLPPLVMPPAGLPRDEGWIYHFEPEAAQRRPPP